MRKQLKSLSLLLALAAAASASAETLKVNESVLLEKASKGAPQLDQIQASFESVNIRNNEEREKFGPELFGRGAYSETHERALISFSPVFTPIKQAQIGVRQRVGKGFSVETYAQSDQRSAKSSVLGKIDNATTTTFAFTMQMDLWKNLFGRLDQAKLKSLEAEKKKAVIEKDIQMKSFKISLRRLYWSLVANQQSLKISEELLVSAKRQANELAQRFRNSVAEADEVARANAQVASREGTITFLKYQRETYYTQLKNLLPELAQYQLELDKYDLGNTLDEVLSCAAVISSEKSVPYQNTQYDEAVAMLREMRTQQAVYNSHYADADVRLFGTVKSTGVGNDQISTNNYRGSVGASIDDMQNNNRTGYEVGVLFTIPLGDRKDSTQRSKEIYDDRRLLASINSTDAQVINTHQEFTRTILLLNDVIKSQKISARELEKRLKGMKRKYEQARVSVTDIVQDQDALLNAELNTIDTQLQILNTIFDYLVVFPDTPCPFNRI